MEDQVTPNPTPSEGGASTLDRLERYLAAQDAPETPEQAQSQTTGSAEETVEPDGDGNEQANEPQLSTSDLAKYLGIDEAALDLDEDGTVKLKTKVDGVEGAAKLQDLLKSYQLQEHVDRKAREAAEREKAVLAKAQEVEQRFAQELNQARRLNQFAMEELTREWQSIDWNSLEQQDPGQAARLWQKYQARVGQIQSSLQQIDQNEQNLRAQAQQRQAQNLQEEAAKLPTLIPEWKDQAVAQKESRELIEWGLKAGYPPETMERLNHSSALDVATFRKAMLFDKLQQSKPQIENKVRTAPKLVKPGQATENTQAQSLRNLKQSVQKSGGKADRVAEYLMATGRV